MTTSPTPRFAVVGNPIAHSRSPAIHTLFGQQTGIALHYTTLLAPIDDFPGTVHRFFAQGGAGLNITVPFKEQAFALAQPNVSDRARMARAVNTLWMHEGKLHGCNTDGVGLLADLIRLQHNPRNKRLLLVGAGGAARGVSVPLIDAGCACLHIVNRTAGRATDLVNQLRQLRPASGTRVVAGSLEQASGPYDIVINATSGSLHGAVPALPAGLFGTGALAYDMVYGNQPTAFMQQALAQGAAQAADGLGMLVGQAAESFRIWHGVTPDIQATLLAVRALVDKG
jgi:shikimate dehydrogenase